MCVENRLPELRERGGNEEWERKMVKMERRKEGRRENKGGGWNRAGQLQAGERKESKLIDEEMKEERKRGRGEEKWRTFQQPEPIVPDD